MHGFSGPNKAFIGGQESASSPPPPPKAAALGELKPWEGYTDGSVVKAAVVKVLRS